MKSANPVTANRIAIYAWVALVLVTFATSWPADTDAFSVTWATTVIMLFAAFKARVIVLH